MGACLSCRIKADNSFRLTLGSILKLEGKEGNHSIGSKSGPHSPQMVEDILDVSNVKSFTFNDMKMATRNFRADSVVGEGGFGCVFKGWINERDLKAAKPGTGMVIAVKKLNHEGYQGHQEWLAEINYLGQLRHPNLVKLIGYCLDGEQRLLVYEFMHRGSLENHLFRRNSYFQPLSWGLRMKVALGAAKGLAFLHNHEVIYRDFKTSNILLDSHYCAKLSDFGLAKDGPVGDESHVSTRVMGTYGYAAPEYLATGHLTTKSDVYSFGVVLLEILSGHRVLDKNHLSGEHKIVEWVKTCEGSKPKPLDIIDPRIEGQYSKNVAHKAANLAIQCVARDPQQRPKMKLVVSLLEQLQEGPNSVGSQGMHGQRMGQSASGGIKNRRKSTNDLPRGKGDIPRGKGASFPRPSPSSRNV